MAEKWNPMKVKMRDIHDVIKQAIVDDFKILIVGNPGIGKTAIVNDVAKELDAIVVPYFLAQEQAEDVGGLPGIIDGKAQHILFERQRFIMTPNERIVIPFLDDCGQGQTRDQTAQMQFLRGFIQGKKVPSNVRFIGCTNDKTDKAGITGMIEPFKSSWGSIIHAETDALYWVELAEKQHFQCRPDIIAHIRANPHELDQFNPTTDLVNSASPRQWIEASKGLNICESIGADTYTTKALFEGSIGSASCTTFFNFKSMVETCATPNVILADPEGSNVPENASLMYAVCLAVANVVTDKESAQKAMRYGRRLPAEFETIMVRQLCQKIDGIKHTKEYTNYVSRHAEILL